MKYDEASGSGISSTPARRRGTSSTDSLEGDGNHDRGSAPQVNETSPETEAGGTSAPDCREKYFRACVPLYNAALKGDWETAEGLLQNDSALQTGAISEKGETVLHVAVGSKQKEFVEKLLHKYYRSTDDYLIKDENGNTAFFYAAAAGIEEVAKRILGKSEGLQNIRGAGNSTPLYIAALFGHHEMASFLYVKTKEHLHFDEQVNFLFTCIRTELYDLALRLVEECPHTSPDGRVTNLKDLALVREEDDMTALHVLAKKPSAFDSCLTLSTNRSKSDCPALKLVQLLWEQVRIQNDVRSRIRCPTNLLLDAAKSGNYHFLTALIWEYPDLLWERDMEDRTIFHMAVLHRHLNIFRLIHDIGSIKDVITTFKDNDGNNILHLTAKLPNQTRLNQVSGAALQMQQELVWFEVVKEIMQPSYREMKNRGLEGEEGQTPWELFIKEHKELLREGEKWMKTTAKSCTIVATLMATVIFAAPFGMPGGYYDDDKSKDKEGTPINLKSHAFAIFAVADAIALSSSIISILMFLFILVSRYSENDFRKSLPNKLASGFVTLFISMISTMVAFAATFWLAYQHGSKWVPSLISGIVCLPLCVYLKLQYGLWDIFLSSSIRSFSKLLFQKVRAVAGVLCHFGAISQYTPEMNERQRQGCRSDIEAGE